MRRFTVSGALVLLSCVAAACDRTPPTDPRGALGLRVAAERVPAAKNFVAHLTGANEVPAHETRGVGQIKLQLSDDGTELRYRLISSNIDNVFMAHIHVAPAGVNGPIVAFLFGPEDAGGGRTDGVLATGTIPAADSIWQIAGTPHNGHVAPLSARGAYANVHTNDGVPPSNTGPGD